MRTQCEHGSVLPRGLLCSRGYLFIRLFPPAPYAGPMPYLEGCGPHVPMSEKAAIIKLGHYRKLIILNEFNTEAVARSAMMDEVCDIYLKHHPKGAGADMQGTVNRVVRPYFGKYKFELITPELAYRWRKDSEKEAASRGLKFSTINRRQAVLSSIFANMERWVKTREDGVPLIRLPKENPFGHIRKPSEDVFARERVPNREEMKAAKAWCLTNDAGLWEAILQATATMLRKGDFVAQIESGVDEGIQGKTGKRFKVRAKFDVPADVTNLRKRWQVLQAAMGWKEKLDDGAPNPKHTVWHDLRHWGPTILGEHGYGTKLIQMLTGHKKEEMANKYTHLREEKVVEAVGIVQREMESL